MAERIHDLAERALEPNPFLLPAFLEPALQALGRRGIRLATFADREDLRFFAPVVPVGGRLFGRPWLRVWTHPYGPLGSPLIDRDAAAQVADGILRHMRRSGRTLLGVPDLPLDGPVAAALRGAAERRGFWIEAAHQMRPVLVPESAPGGFDQIVSAKRRKELERQLRKLSEAGAVSHMSARIPADVETAFAVFVALESSGWKGRRGSALEKQRAAHDFAHQAVLNLARQGLARIDVLRVGKRPVAALIQLHHAGLSIPWKIAYDEAFAPFSPGKQLMYDATRRWLRDPHVRRVDPVCGEDNALMAGLWSERELYGTLLISSGSWGVRARVTAGLIDMRQAAKRQVKAALRPRRRHGKTAAPTARKSGRKG